MDFLNQLQRQATLLRRELVALGMPAPLTPDQSLGLAARIHGHADWNTLLANKQRRYFHDRHLPYLPNPPHLVRALSVRRAALEDLADVEAQMAGDAETWSGPWVATLAAERALRQARESLAVNGSLAMELQQALLTGVTGQLNDLQQQETAAEQALAHVGSDAAASHRDRPYAALVRYTDEQAEQYHAAYLHWRLATLAASLCAVCERQGAPALAALLANGVDPFAYVGAVLWDQEEQLGTLTPQQLQQARAVGRTVLVNVQTNGSLETRLQYPGSLRLQDAPVLCAKLLARFPEIAFWHAWVELKPLLAPGIDSLLP
jgi:hypothetical protein